MDCQTITPEELSAYSDDELGFDRTLAVESHLESCHICKENLREIEEVKRLLKDVLSVPAPRDLKTKVLGKVYEPIRWRIVGLVLTVLACLIIFLIEYLRHLIE